MPIEVVQEDVPQWNPGDANNDVKPKEYVCATCGKSNFRSANGLKQHELIHSDQSEDYTKDEKPRKKGSKKKLFTMDDDGLSPVAESLAIGVFGFIVAYLTAQSVEGASGEPLTEQEIEMLAISEQLGSQMFKPLVTRAGKVPIIAGTLNKIAEQQDLIACGIAWKMYFDNVKLVRASIKERVTERVAFGGPAVTGDNYRG